MFYTCKYTAADGGGGGDLGDDGDDDFYKSSPPTSNPQGGVTVSVDGPESSIPPITCPCWSPYPS